MHVYYIGTSAISSSPRDSLAGSRPRRRRPFPSARLFPRLADRLSPPIPRIEVALDRRGHPLVHPVGFTSLAGLRVELVERPATEPALAEGAEEPATGEGEVPVAAGRAGLEALGEREDDGVGRERGQRPSIWFGRVGRGRGGKERIGREGEGRRKGQGREEGGRRKGRGESEEEPVDEVVDQVLGIVQRLFEPG